MKTRHNICMLTAPEPDVHLGKFVKTIANLYACIKNDDERNFACISLYIIGACICVCVYVYMCVFDCVCACVRGRECVHACARDFYSMTCDFASDSMSRIDLVFPT